MAEKKISPTRAPERRRVADLEVLHQMGLALAAIRDPEALLQHAVDTVRQAFGYYYVAFLAYDPQEQLLWPAAYSGSGTLPPRHVRFPLDVGLTGLAARQREPVIVNDVRQDPRYVSGGVSGVGAEAAFPLQRGDQLFGVLSVAHQECDVFDQEASRTLTALTNQIAVALENARLFADSQRRVQELSTLTAIGTALNQALTLEETLDRVLQALEEILGPVECSIVLSHEPTNTLRMVAARHLPAEKMTAFNQRGVRCDEGTFGIAIQTGELVEVADTRTDPRVSYSLVHDQDDMPGQVTSIPLRAADGTIMGALAVGTLLKEPNTRRLVLALADLAAIAIHRARRFEEEQRRLQEIATLRDVGAAITASLDLPTILRAIYQATAPTLNADTFYVAFLEGDAVPPRLSFAFVVDSGTVLEPFTQPLDQERGLVSWVIRHRQPLLLRDLPHDSPVEPIQIGEAMRSSIIVPIVGQDRLIGVIAAQSQRPAAFDERHQWLLAAVADQAAIAIQHARLFADLQLMNRDLEAMLESQRALLAMVRELSSPVMPVFAGVLVMPLIGPIDSQRAQQITHELLAAIETHRASFAIIDITGVPVMDSYVARYLANAMQAARLVGAEPVLVGIAPAVAQTMVEIRADLGRVVTRRDLQSGLAYALHRLKHGPLNLAGEEEP